MTDKLNDTAAVQAAEQFVKFSGLVAVAAFLLAIATIVVVGTYRLVGVILG